MCVFVSGGGGVNRSNHESVDGSNTLGQSVSIKWKKVYCLGGQGLPTEIEINWDNPAARNK